LKALLSTVFSEVLNYFSTGVDDRSI